MNGTELRLRLQLKSAQEKAEEIRARQRLEVLWAELATLGDRLRKLKRVKAKTEQQKAEMAELYQRRAAIHVETMESFHLRYGKRCRMRRREANRNKAAV